MRPFLSRLANLFCARQAEREMAREVESHLALLREEFERQGLSSNEALRAARLALGGVEQAKELHRETRAFVWIEQLFQDLHYAWRGLRSNPGFTLLAVFALALGLGANASIFAVYDAVALKPLPVAHPQSVMRLKRSFAQSAEGSNPYGFSLGEYRYLRDHSAAFSSVVGEDSVEVFGEIAGSPAKERFAGRAVSANYFEALGIAARLGRTLRSGEDSLSGGNPVVVLTHRFWQRRFQGNPNVIGQTIKLNGLPYLIIGVTPPKFTGTDLLPVEFDFWAPLSMLRQLVPASRAPQKADASSLDPRDFSILARLNSSVTRPQAQAEAELLIRRYDAGFHDPAGASHIALQRTSYFGDLGDFSIHAIAAIVSGVVSLVLLAACANVANMLLARGAGRQREIGIRMAMGAGRARVARHLILESVLIALLGGAVALPLSVWAGQWFWVLVAQFFRGYHLNLAQPDLGPSVHLLAYGFALSLLTGVLFGLAPALRFTRLDLHSAMKTDGASQFGRSRLRGALLGVQAAVSLLLLLFSGGSLSELKQTSAADLGFDTGNTYLVGFDGDVTHQQLRDAISTAPGIAATAIGDIPLQSDMVRFPMKAGHWNDVTLASHESDGYFETMGIPLQRGRSFTRQDTAQSAAVAVVSESTARICWPKEDPVGKHLSLALDGHKFYNFEVIGVVRDVRHESIEELDPLHVYLPTDGTKGTFLGGLMIRIRGDRRNALAAAQAAVATLDSSLLPGLQFVNVAEGPVAMQRGFFDAVASVITVLTLLALTLASVGIYGVMAFLVNQRSKEIGIRVALGSAPRLIFRNVVFQGLRPVFIGMAIGVIVKSAEEMWDRSTDLVRDPILHRLFGDPLLYIQVLLMLAIAILASVIPARRALRIDPVVTLRHD